MRRFLIAGHLDGQLQTLPKLHTLVQERRPDGVLFAGGLGTSNMGSTKEKLKMWEDCFAGLGKLGVFTALIPGTAEAPLREFLRLAKDVEVDYPTLHVAHAWLFEQGDVAICGLGGELTESEDRTEDRLCFARASAEYFLRALW
jgi:hypothetical protein